MTHAAITKQVTWKDLKTLSPLEVFIENSITLPWLLASWLLAYYGFYLLAMPFSAVFFLTALRQAHNGFHSTLGTNKPLTWLSLYLNSILMMASMHAVKYNHIRHHKYCLGEQDYEGKCANLSWYGALLYGPVHIFQIHRITYLLANKGYLKKMAIELVSIAAFTAVVFVFNIQFLMYHVIIMVVGEMFSAFFAVWTVHHDAEGSIHNARTQRKPWKNWITFSMFYHLEHHLFPAVPTIKLPELARRIDVAVPNLQKKTTF